MTEEEFQRQAGAFIKQLPHYPQAGKRPFGYPKSAWLMSGAWAVFGILLQLPLALSDGIERWAILASVGGAFLLGCAFTMRVLAFTSAAGGAMDLWLYERVKTLEVQLPVKGSAEPGSVSPR